jgi:hypothetical protein
MCVDHCGLYVAVAEKLLDSADVVACGEQVRGEAMPQGVRTDRLCESSGGGGALYGALNDVGTEMMPPAHVLGAGIGAQPPRRENPLPLPRSRGAWVFDRQRVRQPHTAESLRNVRILQLTHADEVLTQGANTGERQHRGAVMIAFSIANGELPRLKVDVFTRSRSISSTARPSRTGVARSFAEYR